ncbi:MAG: ABC transporter permease [Anaerolineales bacterium]|nr:ABC transporter permease [Anaerolineales bacterium]MBS3753227.1 ABC transporter permease [Anaerolineales bacterium]
MEATQIEKRVERPEVEERKSDSDFMRIAKYMGVRLVLLAITIVIGVYLAVLIANMGGYVDEIRKGVIKEQVGMQIRGNPAYEDLTAEERQKLMAEMVAQEIRRLGLDEPFIIRSFGFLEQALTLNLGRAEYMTSDTGSKQVRLILLERLPATLVMWGASNLLVFILSLLIALGLSRKYGTFFDKMIIALTPTSSAPAWFYGLFLILIFAVVLEIAPFGGLVAAPPPENKLRYALSVLRHLALPAGAILVSSVPLTAYNWRTFFLIYSSEDYVDMAKAKGLSSSKIERRYILRPTLPTIVTSFALLVITLWTGAIILETVFNWPGIGKAYNQAIGLYDTPVIVGNTVIYAYLLAITVFLLDFIYALVDPRVQVGSGTGNQL